MKRCDLLTIALAMATISSAAPPVGRPVPGQLLVQSRIGVSAATATAAVIRAGGQIQQRIDRINVHVVRVPEPAIARVSAALMGTGLFTFVERDQIALSSAGVTATDPYFPSEWHLTAIKAPDAWAITTGSSNVLIGVIDSGGDWTHPDLAPSMVTGWNFLKGNTDTQDTVGHGTAVSGAAAAATNNATGVAAVSWGNKIMPLLISDSSSPAYISALSNAITYAADRGVRILSVSICWTSPSSTLQSAVDYAWSKGSVVFAAAGNSSSSAPTYPAATNNVVAVSATDVNGTLASFSSYGNWIDLSAPGNNILTTKLGGIYSAWYGTSFSTPITAAVGALVLSIKPGLSASSLVNLLEQNSDDLGAPGYDQYFGHGQVNAYKALLAAGSLAADTTLPSVSITSPSSAATVAGTIQVQGSASDNVGVTGTQLYIDNQLVSISSSSPFSFAWNTLNYTNGSHTLQVKASDAAGNIGSTSVSVNVYNPVVSDTMPPVVTIGSPTSGSSVKGNLLISASATDNVGISQVAIYIDDTLRCTDTASPYTCSWNTKKASSGSHTIKVTAWDAAGNFSSATTTVYK